MAEALITAAKCFVPKSKEEEEEIERIYNSYRNIIATLPRNRGWATQHLCQYQGFWFQPMVGLEGIMWMQQHFISRPTDLYLISSPKSVQSSFSIHDLLQASAVQLQPSSLQLQVFNLFNHRWSATLLLPCRGWSATHSLVVTSTLQFRVFILQLQVFNG
ncbi:uncharacterized protein LOC116146336 [Pistacia vera]|uniref:uncharacterized protein LOC116146336 n=1 Tax=Pistacia vera TaxID=55513 RepID=UPI001263878F|nr:uncharacterized protein LOC116146336 [Pistacia vera]